MSNTGDLITEAYGTVTPPDPPPDDDESEGHDTESEPS